MYGVRHKKINKIKFRSKYFCDRYKLKKFASFSEISNNSVLNLFTKLGHLKRGIKIICHRSLTKMYFVAVQYVIFRAILKARFLYFYSMGNVFILAIKRREAMSAAWVLFWYLWFSFIVSGLYIHAEVICEIIPIFGKIVRFLAVWIGR